MRSGRGQGGWGKMDLESICFRIQELEDLKEEIELELMELYELRQQLWEEERKHELREYWGSVL